MGNHLQVIESAFEMTTSIFALVGRLALWRPETFSRKAQKALLVLTQKSAKAITQLTLTLLTCLDKEIVCSHPRFFPEAPVIAPCA